MNPIYHKYLLPFVGLFIALSSLMGQSSTIINDSVMMIGPDVDSLTEQERYFNPTYLVVVPGKEYLRDQLIRASVCDCDTTIPNRRIGVFSVSKDKQVSFSQGNLQYLPAANLWKFADTQYEYLGNSNKYLRPTYRNWVDLFDWSGVAGVSFLDWGLNEICGDATHTWRTLTTDEWKYLLHDRKDATKLLLPATLGNTLGLVVLPDNWICPEGLELVTLSQMNATWDASQRVYQYSSNIYLSNEFSPVIWQRLENAGAVFLPASGYINKDGVLNACGTVGRYWSATPNQNAKGYYMSFGLAPTSATNTIRTQSAVNADNGHTVRLVHDTIVPPPAPCETITVNGVSFNMMCVEGDKYDYLIGQTEVTRALWKAVMGKIPSGSTATDVPVDNVTWDDCQEFINQLNSLTGLHFRFPTKEEWLYAAKGGPYNKDFLYSGSDNIDEVGWYDGNTSGGVQPVAQLKPNALGIYDMTGNVWEWVLQTSDNVHLYMGGSYAFGATSCLLGNKGTATAPDHKGSIGLRLVLDTHQYVDLGLSVLWATCNVGATTPEEYGDYFAWGETEPKEVYDWSTYKWCDGTENSITKYNTTDGLKTLLPEDDAAHVNWGGEWRMPSEAELTELREYCTWQWTTQNGTAGYIVTGPNGNSIFLPDAGYRITTTHTIGTAYYWTRDLNTTAIQNANGIYFNQDRTGKDKYRRRCGFSVRPVLPADREILTPTTPGKRIGVFSVAKDKQVSFSQGNLQYIQSANLWLFADNQYDYIGEGNIKDNQLANRIDLFGWSGKNSKAPWGISTSNKNADYVGEFLDWGTNAIQGDMANTWRSMSADEWMYIFHGRKHAESLFACAQVNGISGVVLLPDDWILPEGLSFIPSATKGLTWNTLYDGSYGDANTAYSHYQDNSYTLEQWQKMEDAGAVFLPAAGYRKTENNEVLWSPNKGYIEGTTIGGSYFTYTKVSSSQYYFLRFSDQEIRKYPYYFDRGRSVRLVHDTIVPPPAPCETITVNGVKFNMMCVEGGTFMMGAAADDTTAEADEKPQHQVTLSDFMIGQTEVTQNLWEAVMGSYPSTIKGDSLPVNNVSWEDCQTFITKLNALTGLYFRLPTEAEWEFAARGGNKSKDFVYAGSDNIDEVAWHIGNSGNMTHPVATKQPNEIGIYDMSGNVWEWCLDWNGDYTTDMHTNPQGPTIGEYRMYRGGGWKYADKDCRVTRRRRTASYDKTSLGLRLVLDKHAYVDLGLSVLWATTNVGANEPEEYGDYYAWGETETKDYYGWSTYKWCNGTENTLTKYCSNPSLGADGFTDGLTTLLPEDDAAHVHWGSMWQMATKSEFRELIDNCNWETTTLNGVKGYRVTSTVPGYTDRSIFLPLAGYHNHDLGASNVGTSVRYWSSSGSNTSASDLYMATLEGNTRRIGMSIRPVLPTHRKINTPKAEPSKRVGLFSVGKGKHVTFSQGNLVYLKLKKQWLFAPNQLYYTGERHLQNGQIADTVMYFGWSAKDSKAPWGISTSTNLDHYKGEFLDWGINTIQGDKPNTWRTMTDDEVVYLLEGRPNAAQLIGFAEVDGIKGMIILPDDWQLPEGLSFTPFDGSTINHYTLEQWQQMENVGSVIIPAAGYFNNKLSPKMRDVNTQGYMPYSVLLDSLQQQYSYLDHDKILHRWPGNNTGNLFYAFPRRLVHDTVIPEYVDMGLSVKWANYNLGASTPTGVGDYYAWGETEPKDSYMPANYQWCMGSAKTYTKYCTVDSMGYNGFTDDLTTLQPQDDAAQMQKGGHWRMPTDAEWEELRKNCTWTQAEQGGQIGYIATSKINGNRMFIPVAGFRSGGHVVLEYLGAYWSSSLNETKQSCAYGLYINKDEDRVGKYSNSCREYGFLIRPVYDENYHAYVDLGLSVMWATTNIGANLPEEYGDYFAWGETEPKDNFTWENYTWCDGTKSTITKYNAADGLTTLLPEDDAAYVNWGRGWRMPTNDELTELRTSCTWEAMTKDGVKGIQVTGPNGNSIFIPLGGSYNTFDDQLNSVGNHGWLYSSTRASADNQAREIGVSSSGGTQTTCSRCVGLNIRPVFPKPDDGKVTVTVVPTQSDATVSLLCIGYTREGNSITVDKGKSVLYLVSNVADRYLSQGDSLLNLTRDTTLYVTLEPFSDGVWEKVEDSLLEYTPDCYISRNCCAFAKYESWSYYVMPASEGETYRIQTIAGQHAAPWIAVSTPPDIATLTRAKQIACSPIKGPAGYLAEEVTVPAGTKYLIINRRKSSSYPLKVEKKSFYKTYYYGFTDEQFAAATSTWNPPGMGWAIIDQSPIQGKVLYGIRMKVAKAGSFNLYKVTTLAETSESNMQFVTTVTTSKTGLQNIDFEAPFYLAADEYLVVSRPSDASTTTLIGNHMTSDNMLQPFYRQVGTPTVSKANVSSLMVDFY